MALLNPTKLMIAVLMLLCPGQAVAAEKHLLVMDREEAVGDTYRVQMTASGSEANSQLLGGQKIGGETKQMSAEMTAVIEVLSLHEDGSVESVAMTVEAFEGEVNGEPIKIDTAKRLIATGEADGIRYVYEQGAEIQQPEVIELFDLFGEFIVSDGQPGEDDEESPSEQALFYLDEPRQAGTEWQANEELMAKDLSDEGLIVDPKDMTSQVSFIDIKTHNDQACANLAIRVEAAKLALPALEEEGFALDQSSMLIAVSGLLPLDPKVVHAGTFNLGLEMAFSASADLPQGKLQIAVDVEKSLEISHLPLK